MRSASLTATAVLAAMAAVACTADSPTTLTPDEPLFAKPGGGDGLVTSDCGGKTQLRDSRARLTWSGSFITGDASGDTFEGDQGSVHAKIFYHDGGCSRSGDLVFDADMNGKKDARHLTFYFPARNDAGLPSDGVAAAPFVNFQGLMFLGSDIGEPVESDSRDAKVEEKDPGADRAQEYPPASAERPGYPTYNLAGQKAFRFRYMGVSGCDELEYARIKLTRTAGSYSEVQPDPLLGQWSDQAADLGVWTVESLPAWADLNENGLEDEGETAHWAQCYATVQGSLQQNGAEMDMPFVVTIWELRK